jgi:hypothetical protein
MKIKERYTINKSAKVGDSCICPSCQAEFVKEYYQQSFCKTKSGTKCKDKYWNTVTPTKRNNTTRISPASKRWLSKMENERSFRVGYDDVHPFSSEALGQWDD